MADNPVSLPDLQKALDDLILDAFPMQLEPGDVTIMRYKIARKCSYETAQRELDELTEAGKLEFLGERLSHGHKVKAWRIKERTH